MANPVAYDIAYTEQRNRLTNAFRIILAIPVLIVSAAWSYFAEILAFIQWFIIVFTGKRNRSMWDLQHAFMGFYGRVSGYAQMLFDPYPPFGTDPGQTRVRYEQDYEEPASRLTNGLRFIWIIPALFVGLALAIAAFFVSIVTWFAIVITGRQPRGQFDFLLKYLRFSMSLQSYGLLMTDAYPTWSAASGPPALPPAPGTPGAPLGQGATYATPATPATPPPPPPASTTPPPPASTTPPPPASTTPPPPPPPT